ncbi:leucine-rich repeat extensin-like protein 4 [Forsythia ovata]|uniref:Leucine-rich repeat extensin-like protein 4 n=1 Tax=Forsythia ovata TaxID=205694 RepID=A0ABD1S0V2_9LAMI
MKEKSNCIVYFQLILLVLLPLLLLLPSLGAANVTHNKVVSNNGPLTDAEAHYIKQRQLLYYKYEFGDRCEKVTVDPTLVFENPRQRNAYVALQALKQAILSYPQNLTTNWVTKSPK